MGFKLQNALIQARQAGLLLLLLVGVVGAAACLVRPEPFSLLEKGLREAWRPSQAPRPGCADAVRVEGTAGFAPLMERRQATLDGLKVLESAGPKSIVLEDWLDESSQPETQALLESLRRDWETAASGLPKKTRRLAEPFGKMLDDAQSQVKLDHSLAVEMAERGNVILPVAAVPGDRGAVAKPAFGFEVTFQNQARPGLDQNYSLSRQPLDRFLQVAASVAVVEGQPGGSDEVPAFYQLGKEWVPGLGIEAALRDWGLTRASLRFYWKKEGLFSFEVKGHRQPISSKGLVGLPRLALRPQIRNLTFEQATADPAALRQLAGKVVFFRPWPAYLGDGRSFERQEDLFTCLWAGLLGIQESRPFPWMSLAAFGLAAALGCAGLLFGGRRQGAAFWLAGFASLKGAWSRRLALDTGEGNFVSGTYVAADLRHAALRDAWQQWAARHDAFVDWLEPRSLGFFLADGPDALAPLAAAWDLKKVFPSAKLAFSRGDLRMVCTLILDRPFWTLEGPPKEEAQAMLAHAKAGGIVIHEGIYQAFRSRVQIQMLDAVALAGGDKPVRLFNVLQLLS